jgi:hypothetical protein
MNPQSYWTNRSVRVLAGDKDPVGVITQKARAVILNYIEAGGLGPPFDPLDLASYLKVSVIPSQDVRDARTIYTGGKFQVEFNPNRSQSRVRYSISHELVHTLFPDCKEQIRHRATHEEMTNDEWQLEMLCNIGASELLMPIGSFPQLQSQSISVDSLLELRAKFEVSVEALLLRFIKLTGHQCAIFSASRKNPDKEQYKIDYAISSLSLPTRIPNGTVLPADSVVSECTAIGFTAKRNEVWPVGLGNVGVECVGIPPYPNQTFPRVMGIVRPTKHIARQTNRPTVVKGDATKPRGAGKRIIAFVVNDKTPRWGAGFALEVRKKWPLVQEDFTAWADKFHDEFRLGKMHLSPIESDLTAAELICQHGYGDSRKPRLRYNALRNCLDELAGVALEQGANIHMPRIGSGQARGNWSIVLEMIEDTLSRRGLEVIIYELPNNKAPKEPQLSLDFANKGIF